MSEKTEKEVSENVIKCEILDLLTVCYIKENKITEYFFFALVNLNICAKSCQVECDVCR